MMGRAVMDVEWTVGYEKADLNGDQANDFIDKLSELTKSLGMVGRGRVSFRDVPDDHPIRPRRIVEE